MVPVELIQVFGQHVRILDVLSVELAREFEELFVFRPPGCPGGAELLQKLGFLRRVGQSVVGLPRFLVPFAGLRNVFILALARGLILVKIKQRGLSNLDLLLALFYEQDAL